MAKSIKKGNSKIYFIIGGIVILAGGIGLYLISRKRKQKAIDISEVKSQDIVSNNVTAQNISSSTLKTPNELNTTDKVKAFQDWMDAQGKGWIKKDGKWVLLNKGAGYGNYGKSTDAVWKVYGKQYLESLKSTPKGSPKKSSSDISFENARAIADENNKRAFIWENQVYRTSTGKKVLEYNPINVKHYSKIAGQIAKKEPKASSSAVSIPKNLDVGSVRGVDYNNDGLWFYLPDNGGDYKWGLAKYFSRNITSNFDGITDEIEFLNFNNNFDLNL
jgi:hypothetical protein